MPTSTTYYTTCSPIIVGCTLYINPGFTTFAPNGYYSNGVNVFQVTGGAGVVSNITNCPITTTVNPCFGDCCFVGTTMILMAEKGIKRIDEIQVNDLVLTYNEATNQVEENRVKSIRNRQSSNLVKYTFYNGVVNISTADHPYYVNGFNIASSEPFSTKVKYGFDTEVDIINIGDTVNLADGDTTYISEIEPLIGTEMVYTLEVENNHNYYANGVLVHNKEFFQICCENTVTGQFYTINNAGGSNHPGCCCLGPNWVNVDPLFCNINPEV